MEGKSCKRWLITTKTVFGLGNRQDASLGVLFLLKNICIYQPFQTGMIWYIIFSSGV